MERPSASSERTGDELNSRGERPLADRPLADLLAQVAAQRPAPGGGTSAALTCALAAGLTEMAAAFTLAGERYADSHDAMQRVRERAAVVRHETLALAERELHSYEPVLEAMRLPPDASDRERRVAEALSQATDPPLAIARAAAEVAELGAEAADGGNLHLRGDAITGVLLAEAACRSAGRLVEANLAQLPQDPRTGEILELVTRGDAARRRVLDGD